MNLTQLLLFSLFFSSCCLAEIHKWVDENGQIHYSDKKPENTKTQAVEITPFINSNPTTYQIKNKATTEPSQNNKSIYKKKHKVVMYAASWCGYCKKARTFFRKNNIRYREYDIESDDQAKQRYEKLGGSGVPLIVSGKKKMQGFSEKRFASFYQDL